MPSVHGVPGLPENIKYWVVKGSLTHLIKNKLGGKNVIICTHLALSEEELAILDATISHVDLKLYTNRVFRYRNKNMNITTTLLNG